MENRKSMKKAGVITAKISLSIFLSFSLIVFGQPVKADSTAPINFPDTGVTFFSPVNTTYSTKFLNLTVRAAAPAGANIKYTMQYGIDGQLLPAFPVKVKTAASWNPTGDVDVNIALPELSEGSHSLTVKICYTIEGGPNPPTFAMSNTMYFAIKTRTSTPTATSTLYPTAAPTPTVPEYPSMAILPLFAAITLTAIILLRRKSSSLKTYN